MTVYFTVVPEITPALLQWARAEHGLRQREEEAIRSPGDLHAYKRRRGLRRRNAGLSRDLIRRMMAIVEAESLERAA